MANKKNTKYNNRGSNNYRANYNNRKPRVSNYNRKIEVLDDDYSLTQQQQFDFGMDVLKKYGDVIETSNGWQFIPFD